MPPARKDSTEADGPSTSRAFSPVLVPPVKRARVSTGGVPPAASRRQSTGTTRQARLDEFIDEKPVSDPPSLSSRARVNWRRLGARILAAKTPPTPSLTLGLFEMKRKEGCVYEIRKGAFSMESDGTELCRSVEERVRDASQRKEDQRRDETGRVKIWPGGEAMGYWILEGVIGVQDKRVMEIGCGVVALPARVAVWKGARGVRATDGSEECVEGVKRSMERGGGKMEVERMEWGRRSVKEEEKMDVVLAADAVFFERSHEALLETIDSWMGEGGETWIAAPERRGSLLRWKRKVEEDGRWKMEEWREAEERLRREVEREIDEDEDMPRLIRITRL